MNTLGRFVVCFVLMWCVVFVVPPVAWAQVVINEFLVKPSPQWIELYNTNGSSINISGWVIDDDGSSASYYEIPNGTIIEGNKCLSFESGKFYWNTATADKVRLLSSGIVINEYGYQTPPNDNVSIGRLPDGSGDLGILSSTSRDKFNSSGQSCLGSLATPTPTPISTPSKAVYKINKSKDNFGVELTDVEIYVDGKYVHHVDDEILEFYDDHNCYDGVSCGFGTHSIELRKNGYKSWSDSRNFQAGGNYEVSPVLDKEVTATPTPTPRATPTPTPKVTRKPSPTPSPSGENLEVLKEPEVLGLGERPEPSAYSVSDDSNTAGKIPIFAYVFLILGAIICCLGGFLFFKYRKNDQTDKTES